MKKTTRILNITFVCLLGLLTMSSTPTVYFIGDSTMADYDPTVYPNQRGWGQMFRNFLTGDISFVNAARNGRSSRSFYTGADSLWAGVRTKLKAGDYVFIQFAHNDEKFNGLSDTAKLGVGTAPWGDYQDYLRRYVNESRKLGATPILVTSIVRCYFAGDTITFKGRHNLGADDSTLNYTRALKAVARQLAVPLIDHTALTRKYAESLGATNAASTIYISGDQTHLNPTGATLYAQLAVQDMIKQNILATNLNASPNLIITPGAIDFGTTYISAASASKISVSGLSLSPTAGSITVSAPDGFSVGLASAGTFASSVQLAYTGGNLAATDVYIHFVPTAQKSYADSIAISYGSTVKKISVKGTGLSMSGGVSISINYPLTSSTATATVSGPIIGIDESATGMYVKSYASIATWPTGVTGVNVQRNSISATSTNVVDAWPAGEIDINTSRYIQFGVKPNAGTKLNVDSVGLYAGAAGGSGLRFRVLYSKSANFSNPVTLEDRTSNTSNTMVALSYKPMVQIADSEGFYLRFYPWYNGAASLKYLCLSNLTIQGRVSTVSAVDAPGAADFSLSPNPASDRISIHSSAEIKSISIQSLNGMMIKEFSVNGNREQLNVSDLQAGFYLVVVRMSDHSCITRKIIINK